MDDLSEDGSVTCRHKGALLGHTSSCNGARQNNRICSNTWIPLPGDGRSFLILSRINLLFNFIFHLDSNHRKALQPSILNVSGEAEEHANTACFWCAGTWRAFWFHMRSPLHAASGLLSFLRSGGCNLWKREKIREMETTYWAGRERRSNGGWWNTRRNKKKSWLHFPKPRWCLFSLSKSSGKQRGRPLNATRETKKIGW